MQPAKYPYGEDFQIKILALMVQDPTFLAVYQDAINPLFFERVQFTTVSRLLLDYYRQYRTVPDYSACCALVEDHAQKSRMQQDIANYIRQTVHWIYSNIIPDPDFIKDQVLRFGQRQALKGAVNQIIDKLEKDDTYEDCRSIVEKALQVGVERSTGTDFGAVAANLPKLAAESNTYSRRIPTMLPSLDRCLMGGLGVGELGVIIAPPGIGKSTTLTNFGYGAVAYGFNVLHITLELKEIDIALKYGARHTWTPIANIVNSDANYFQTLQNSPVAENRLKIKYFSPGTATTSNFRALLSYLRGTGFQPDLLIVDYIKKMKYDGDIVGGLGRISDELIAIGDDFKLGVWTAQQAQRSFRFAERTSVSGIANDVSIIENADVALALSQNEVEHREDRVRIELGKVRRGDDIYTICCWCKYDTGVIQEMDAGSVAAYYGVETPGGS